MASRPTSRLSLCAGLALLTAVQIGCNRNAAQLQPPPGSPSLGLKSASFSGDAIPNQYSSCDGQTNISPELS